MFLSVSLLLYHEAFSFYVCILSHNFIAGMSERYILCVGPGLQAYKPHTLEIGRSIKPNIRILAQARAVRHPGPAGLIHHVLVWLQSVLFILSTNTPVSDVIPPTTIIIIPTIAFRTIIVTSPIAITLEQLLLQTQLLYFEVCAHRVTSRRANLAREFC